ncbi:MAG: K(+)-transporting ATPase subunit F [Gammaproteobacteria bacterium]
MTFYLISLVLSISLFIYLLFVLFKPEKF